MLSNQTRFRRLVPWLAVIATAGLLLALAPPPVPGNTPFGGDGALSARAQTASVGHQEALSIALIDVNGTRLTSRSATPDDDFEIGSLTKTFNGMLLADAVERGEVSLETRLDEIFDLQGTQVASVTLGELATHTSGLPRLPSSPGFLVRTVASNYLKSNPYTQSTRTLLDYARSAGLSDRGTYLYSNFGAALLGQALARASGIDYPQLVAARITKPLGMSRTWVAPLPGHPADASLGTAPTSPGTSHLGHSPSGYRAAPWPGDGFAPAGAIRSTSSDLARLATALLDGTAPGIESINRQEPDDDDQPMGLFWHLSPASEGTELITHSGMAAGFAAYIALDPASHRAVVVLGNQAHTNSDIGLQLLHDESLEVGT